MKLFRVNDKITSYLFPILKIVFSVSIIIISCLIDFNLKTDIFLLNIIIRIGAVLIFICSILHIYIAGAEILLLNDRRRKERTKKFFDEKNSTRYSVDYILSLAESSDIIEIMIASKGHIIEIGSSSNSKAGKSKLFDKRYYVEELEFDNIDDFKNALLDYADDDKMIVVSIDGVYTKNV